MSHSLKFHQVLAACLFASPSGRGRQVEDWTGEGTRAPKTKQGRRALSIIFFHSVHYFRRTSLPLRLMRFL